MKKSFLSILILIGIFFSINVSAQPELDTSFNGTGTVERGTSFTFLPQDVAVQSDNKAVALSWCINTSTQMFQFCFIRLNENGSLDTTFHSSFTNSETGTAIFAIPGSNVNAGGTGRGLAVMADGKILAVGSAVFSGVELPVMLRLNANGTLDSTFGTNGVLSYSTGTFFSKVVLQPDGRIVVAGTGGTNQMAARFLPDGTPDNTFGNNGFKILSNPAGNSAGYSIALQADGKIVLGGALTSPSTSYLITRLNANGSPDTAFDDDGYKSIALSGTESDAFVSIAVKSDGRIAAMGNKNILYQLNANGSLDIGFDSDGSRSALNGSSDSRRMIVSASGRITVVGFPTLTFGNGPFNYRVARYLPNGTPDTNFSGDGFLDINATGYAYDGADAVGFDMQGRLFIAGRTWSGAGDYPWQYCTYSAARLLASPAQNVGFSGRVTDTNGKPVFNASITLKNGSNIIGYARTNPFGYFNFNNIPTNQTYKLSTSAKNLTFNDQNVLVDDRITNFLIVGGR
jgi:uncharacterized delta-60 repeat protein